MAIDFTPEIQFTPAEESKHKDARYQTYRDKLTYRKTKETRIPGVPTSEYEQTPLSYDKWLKGKEQENFDKVKGVGEAGLSFLTGLPATFIAGLAGVTAPLNAFGSRDPQKVFEDVSGALTFQPRGDKGQEYTQALGHAMQAFPAVGGYTPHLAVKAPKAAKPSLVDALKKGREEAAPVVDFTPEVPDLRLEHPIAADTRVREMNRRQPTAEDYANRDANVRVVEEEIAANEAAQRAAAQEDFLAQHDASVGQLRQMNETNPDGSYTHQRLIDDTPHGDVPAQYGSTLEHGRVDENGIPIRADLSMEAQNLQDPLQMNLWGDELGPAQGARKSLTSALDSMPPGPARDLAISQLSGIPQKSLVDKVNTVLNDGMGGLSRTQRGAIDPEVFKAGFRNVNRALSKLTDQPWVREAFPARLFETNMDGSPKILLHGTRDAFNDRPRGVSYEGLHAGYGGAATLKAATGSKDGRVGYRERNLSYDYNGTKDANSAMYPVALRKGNYPRLDGDYGSWEPMKLADSRQFKLDLSKATKRGFYDIEDFMESYKDQLKGKDLSAQEENLIFAKMLKNEFDIDGFFYPNKYETAQHQIMSKSGMMKSPQRARNLASKLGLEDSVVTYDDNNMVSLHDQQAQVPSMNSGMSRGQRGALDFGSSAKQKLIEEVTGKTLFAKLPAPADVIEAGLAHGKDSNSSINFSAGGSLEAAKRRSPLVLGAVRIVQGLKNQAEHAIRETVFPTEKALRGLSRDELVELGGVLKAEMFERTPFSMEELANAGMSEKQMLAYNKVREMYASALEAQNQARALKGEKPINAKEAYLSSRWQGDFRVPFYDGNGKLAWYLAADNKLSLSRQADQLLAQFPELTPGDTHVVKSSKRGGSTDVQSVYTTMLDVLGRDDPAVERIKAWAENQLVEDTARTKAQEKHFERKANIRGFVGDRPWNDPFKESLKMFQQQITYAKNAHTWSKLQEAGQSLKEILNNKDLAIQQPNNIAYLREYFADQLGANEHQAIRAIEDLVRDVGISPNQLGRGIGNVKALWVSQKLAVNLGFAASNFLQAGNMLPHMMDLQAKYGGNPISALATGVPLGVAMATGHLGQMGPKFYKTLGKLPGYDEFQARAMKFAEDNSVIARSIYDESPIESSFSKTGTVTKLAGKTITLPETYLRAVTFMTYVEQLRSSGKFKNDLDLFREAEERVNMSMSDYREGERAPIFNKLGNAGNALNVLQTYPMNFYNQWSWALREAKTGNVGPALVMFGVQSYLAGAMGVPGFADADKFLEFGKEWLAEHYPTAWNKVKNFSLKKLALDLGGEAALYGGASKQSGISLTARAAAPSPTEMFQSPGAPVGDLFNQAGDVGALAMDPLNPQKQAQAALSVAPSGLTGMLETQAFRDQTSVPQDGKQVYGKPRSLKDRAGQYARTPEEERLRAFGLRSQREAVVRDQTYQEQKVAQTAQKIVSALPGKIYNQLRNNDKEGAKDFITLYAQLSGKDFNVRQLEQQIVEEYTTPDQRMMMKKNLPVETVLAYKRLQETLKEMGYK